MTTNRITGSGNEYDHAGNMTKGPAAGGSALIYEYDAANRLHLIKQDTTGQPLLQAFQYGSTNARLIDYDAQGTGQNTIYFNVGGRAVAEFRELAQNIQTWMKSSIYMGDRLLSTSVPAGSNEYIEFHHPDRLGTRLITDQSGGTSYEQAHLPFGTALNAESTVTTNPKRFTSYERSSITGLDYAQNRTYDSKLGRFSQVDPIGMKAASLLNPQTLNLYNYVGNDPVNRTDPDGLFWGWIKKFFKAVWKVIRFISIVVAAVVIASFSLNPFGFLERVYSRVNEWLNKCNVPDYNALSQARQDELSQRGVTAGQWDSLKNKARLGYFNIVAAIAAAGLSLVGWFVDWARDKGIQQDRTFFIQGPGATNLLAQVGASSIFKFGSGSFRQNTFFRSAELTFSSAGQRLEVDIDFFNPNKIPFGTILHGAEFFAHKLGRIFGGGSKTNPYNVAYRSSWECE